MKNKNVISDSLENDPNKEKFSDEKTENKIHHHLNDQNDLISDEDIKDVRTDVGEVNDPSPGFSEDELKKLEKEKEFNKNKDNNDHSKISSWDILDI